jgi:predicted esterase
MRKLALAALFAAPLQAQINSTLLVDPPINAQVPARDVELPGAMLYLATEKVPHPTALLLSAPNGMQQNEDLAQSLRRGGWNVLAPRPSADANAAAVLLFDGANVTQYSIDTKHMTVIAFAGAAPAAVTVLAAHPQFGSAVFISPPVLPLEAAAKILPRPVLIFSGEDNTQAGAEMFFQAFKKANSPHSLHLHMRTDHTYATRRIALQSAIVDWLAREIR